MLEMCCENCACSLCANWKTCNDQIFGVEYWCYRCNDMDIDHCFEVIGSCEFHILEKEHKTHPLYNEQTCQKANDFYSWKYNGKNLREYATVNE